MAFPTDWGRRCALVIQSSKVDANQSDFPVLLTKDTLPSEMFDHVGSYPALEGGGDIRFSSDEAGNTQLACEIVSFSLDDADNEAEIWVKIPSVAAGTNTTFHIWYNKTGETQPAIDSTYGAENVWDSSFKMVQHMNEDPSGSAPQIIDSTLNDIDGTSNGSMTFGDLIDGQVGKALDFDGDDDYIDCGDTLDALLSTVYTISAWMKLSVNNENNMLLGYRSTVDPNPVLFQLDHNNDDIRLIVRDDDGNVAVASKNSILIADTWYYIAGIRNGGTINVYVDGSAGVSDTDTFGTITTNSFNIGAITPGSTQQLDTVFKGIIDEVRISNIARSPEWIDASHNNQFSPDTFVIEGTPASPGGAAPTSIFYGPLGGPFEGVI